MPQLVFVSLFLALVSGVQPVEVRSTSDIASVRLELDGGTIASMDAPPWKTSIDLGEDIEPHRLVAIGFDSRGDEIARTSQMLNLFRPTAEVEVVIEHKNGRPSAVTLIGRHSRLVSPRNAVVRVDGRKVATDGFTARLPPLNPSKPHIVEATLWFHDDTVARRETVLEGGFSDSTGTQMTAVGFRRLSAEPPKTLDGCFSSGGTKLRVGPEEAPEALVVIVQDPKPIDALSLFFPPADASVEQRNNASRMKRAPALPRGTFTRIVWPIATVLSQAGESPTALFDNVEEDSVSTGLAGLLTRFKTQPAPSGAAIEHRRQVLHASPITARRRVLEEFTSPDEQPRRIADATTIAGLLAIERPRRRAVVVVLDSRADESIHSPSSIRHYLNAIGVPLFVWSVTPQDPDTARAWGDVQDISTPDGLNAAIARLRDSLDRQGIVWLGTDAFTALHVEVDSACGVVPLARAEQPE